RGCIAVAMEIKKVEACLSGGYLVVNELFVDILFSF
ncbi:MAG: hypothetical protein ACJA01_003904, partial [Saprospiraceae bacterium]